MLQISNRKNHHVNSPLHSQLLHHCNVKYISINYAKGEVLGKTIF